MSDEKKSTKQHGLPRDTARDKGNRDVGHALRSVYSNTVNEDVPDELLDILRQLD